MRFSLTPLNKKADMNSSFKRNLITGYSISLLLLIVSAIASYFSITNLLESQRLVNHTNQVYVKLEDVISVLKDAETGQRGFLLTGNREFLEPYNGSLSRVNRTIDELMSLASDNEDQQKDLFNLKKIVQGRMSKLQELIDDKAAGRAYEVDDLEQGKIYMDQARQLVAQMQNRERSLLIRRTDTMNRFASSTPVLIAVASILSLLVTIVSFYRVNADYENRVRLQTELEQKDQEISRRVEIIGGIADKISSGDYKISVDDEGKDSLGSIATALNKMAESLDYSFTSLSQKEWLQSGIATLNEKMIGEKDLATLLSKSLEHLTAYTGSELGAFYISRDHRYLNLEAAVGLDAESARGGLKTGEGLAGRAAASAKMEQVTNLEETDLVLSFSGGSIKPKNMIAVPVLHEGRVKAVIEMGSLLTYDATKMEFLKVAAENIGTAIQSAQDHQRLEELLAETQAQSEELQAQQSELENINTELEAQSEELQASEEELKVQQEELQQANQELEERSRLLEEKNELILERNLEIQRKAEELELSTRYKSEFLANMSHELRTPLNSILLLSRLLSENHPHNLNSDQVEYAQVIQSSGKGLLTLIDEILDLSKIESGRMDLEYLPLSLDKLTEELKGLFEHMAREKGIEFNISRETGVPDLIETDQLRLEQILRNLLSNALKFTRKGSVVLTMRSAGQDISFSVKDTGIGIPADKQQTIFEAFQQADGSTRRQYGGTGLGLSISRQLARLLGGDISLQSQEGKGSDFTLTIPVSKPAVTDKILETHYPDPSEMGIKPDETAIDYEKYIAPVIPPAIADDRNLLQPGDRIILIIEDDTSFARSLLDYTRSRGYKGIVAVRGDEGIELARQLLPTGILLDIQLPVKSGWEVMDALKSNPQTRPIPVHMMSSFDIKTKGLTKGAVDFINKPVAFEKLGEMFQRIEQALSKHPKKVLIVEENSKHAQALSYFLQQFNVASEIRNNVGDGIQALNRHEVDCVILDMGIPAPHSYEMLEEVKKTPGMENLPIIIFTGKNLSHVEEKRIRQYADSIVIKTAHSYQRILDEVSLFLHLVEETRKNGKSSRSKKIGGVSEVLKGKTVMIVDDDARNIFSLTKSLEHYEVNVISATDGKEALSLLEEKRKVDIILMDMMMPEMDGYESTRRIRANSKYKSLPIIAVTAKAMTGDREKCIEAGASDYITKPVDVDQLISLLRVWLY